MKKLLITLTVALMALGCQSETACDENVKAAKALAGRILPRQSRNIEFVTMPSDSADCYSLEFKDGKLVISGNSALSMAVGLNHYLKEYCNQTVTWYVRDAVKEPRTLPTFEGKISRKALVRDRFFLNYCTFGYSLNWWQWEDWERLIDWMALNGVNMALATTGQESVWMEVWRELGMSDGQIRAYFTGPSFLGWHRMTNMDRWHGPLPQSWLDAQQDMQKKIVARERELGIKPILTSFTGHVPRDLKELYPQADITKLNGWGGFEEECHSWYLHPSDSLFAKVQDLFLAKQQEMYGECDVYGIDPFNELDPPSWDPDYLAEASRLTYESIKKYNPEAVWLQMAWVFYHKRAHWTPERLQAYLTAVPKGKLLMLDYYCDKIELYRTTEKFYGNDFIWSYLGNFGGNTMIAGHFKDVSMKLDRAYAEAGDEFKGIGCTLEGLDVNPFMYEYVLDRAWERTGTDEDWIRNLADRRAGAVDENYRKAWEIMGQKVLKDISGNRSAMLVARPSMEGISKWSKVWTAYDNEDLLEVWKYLAASEVHDAPSWRFDSVNIPRQCLENAFGKINKAMLEAHKTGNAAQVEKCIGLMSEILSDVERLVAADSYFLLGKWIADARRFGADETEEAYYEWDARNIITTWGGRGQKLNDYANRTYAGLVRDYYTPRWDMYFDAIRTSLETGKPVDEEILLNKLLDFEWNWVSLTDKYSSEPEGDPASLCRGLYEKWNEEILSL